MPVKKQPGLIAVDRTIPGRNENIRPGTNYSERTAKLPCGKVALLSATLGVEPESEI